MHVRSRLLLLACLCLPGLAIAAPASLCRPAEEIVFSCHAGAKLLSWCASRAADGKLVYLQYRYGKKTPELAIPPVDQFAPERFNGAMFNGTHGGAEELSVNSGDFVYEVVTTWDRGIEDADVSVLRNGRSVSQFACKPLTSLGEDSTGIRQVIKELDLQPRPKSAR